VGREQTLIELENGGTYQLRENAGKLLEVGTRGWSVVFL
jgi:hypothetical protein